MTLSPQQIAEELERTVDAATPGPWAVYKDKWGGLQVDCAAASDIAYLRTTMEREADGPLEANAAHIAACSPDRILTLVEDWRRLHMEIFSMGYDRANVRDDMEMLRRTNSKLRAAAKEAAEALECAKGHMPISADPFDTFANIYRTAIAKLREADIE